MCFPLRGNVYALGEWAIEKEWSMFSSFSRKSDIWWTLFLVGICSAIAGYGAAFLSFKFYTLPTNVEMIYPAAPLAALLIGPLFWWSFIVKARHLSIKRGIVVGILGSIATHPLTWFLAMLLALLNGSPTVAGVLIFNPLVALGNSLVLSVFSMIEVGGITVLVGGIAGGLMAGLQLGSHCQERWKAVL
jgi:hypothetical protein